MKIRHPLLLTAAAMLVLGGCDRRDGATTNDAVVRDTTTLTVPRQDTVQVERTVSEDTIRDTRPANQRP